MTLLLALVKRLETLEKLQTTYNKINNQRMEPTLDDTNNNASKKKKRKKIPNPIRGITRKMIHLVQKRRPMPIEKPSATMYINIPKFLKIDKPIYNSYRESLHLIITAKYENNVSEFRKISENEKSEIIKRFKCKNLAFPLMACDWAIRRMMRGIINNKRDTEKCKTNSNLSNNSKKKNKAFRSY
ncbi:hypothetical protein C2G38_2239808 [Gigaspora rosea]|uniref:Uncharacterized protein n=1 Tax=Gigaspora rosea TaxID=44941 RepID=A0A397VZN3_9GLOM|nr:hypothetical protein C2G38_2239808 [Gigaspora rosea]